MSDSRPLCRAKYKYEAQNHDELSFPKDSEIYIEEKKDNGWWKGTLKDTGVSGLFPFNYVEELPQNAAPPNKPLPAKPPTAAGTSPTIELKGSESKTNLASQQTFSTSSSTLPKFPDDGKERAIAIEDHIAKETSQLSFKQGDVIIVIQRYPTGWWKGELNGKVGVMPTKSIRPLVDEPKSSITKSPPPTLTTPDSTTTDEKHKRRRSASTKKSGSDDKKDNSKRRQSVAPGKLQGLPDSAESEESSEDTPVTLNGLAGGPIAKTPFKAIAIEPYQSTGTGQLSFNKGDIINVINATGDYWTGELNKGIGLFPADHVQVMQDGAPSGGAGADVNSGGDKKNIAIALFDYKASGDKQLTFFKDDKITVLSKLESGWWRGELNGVIGHFPGSYVKEVSSDGIGDRSNSGSSLNSGNSSPSKDESQYKRASALYEYKANSSSELPLSVGDEIIIIPSSAGETNGWLTGYNVNNPKVIGHFPATYVKITENSISVTKTGDESGGGGAWSKAKAATLGKNTPNNSSPTSTLAGVAAKVTSTKKLSIDKSDTSSSSTSSTDKPNKPLPSAPGGSDATSNGSSVPPSKTLPLPPGGSGSGSKSSSTESLPTFDKKSSGGAAASVPSRTLEKTLSTPDGQRSNSLPADGSSNRKSVTLDAKTVGSSLENDKFQEQMKTALVRLQQQTKSAVEEMMQRLDATNKERLKLEYVMRDMKRTMTEEKEARVRIEQQNKVLYQEVMAIKNKNSTDNINDEFSQMSANDLKVAVRNLTSKLDQETRSRQDLQSLVSKLQADIESLQRQVKNNSGMASTGSGNNLNINTNMTKTFQGDFFNGK